MSISKFVDETGAQMRIFDLGRRIQKISKADFADIEDFLSSIEKLKQVMAKLVISGHAGPFNGNLAKRFEEYGEIIHSRDRLLLEKLQRPKSLENFRGGNLFYNSYPDFPDLIRWFELVHIEKHLMRLKTMGKVRQEDDKWIRA